MVMHEVVQSRLPAGMDSLPRLTAVVAREARFNSAVVPVPRLAGLCQCWAAVAAWHQVARYQSRLRTAVLWVLVAMLHCALDLPLLAQAAPSRFRPARPLEARVAPFALLLAVELAVLAAARL